MDRIQYCTDQSKQCLELITKFFDETMSLYNLYDKASVHGKIENDVPVFDITFKESIISDKFVDAAKSGMVLNGYGRTFNVQLLSTNTKTNSVSITINET